MPASHKLLPMPAQLMQRSMPAHLNSAPCPSCEGRAARRPHTRCIATHILSFLGRYPRTTQPRGEPAKAPGQPAKAPGQPAKAPGQAAKASGQPDKAPAVSADTAGGPEGSGDGGHLPAFIETIDNCVAVVADKELAAEKEKADASPMELIMSRAKGRVYATKAAAYDEEERDEPLVNDELVAKAGTQKAIADAYCKENARRAGELKDCLVLITHLAKKASEVDAGALTWEVYTKKSCDEFLFNREMLNLSPDSDDMLKSLIRHSGHTPDSPEGLKVAAIAMSQGKLRHACVRFNDRIGKIYRLTRIHALTNEPCVFMGEKRSLKGLIIFYEPKGFPSKCKVYVTRNDSKFFGLPWHVLNGVPFSTDGFILCAALWDSEWDGSLPIALFHEQLLVLLAVVRSKLRNPRCNKAQFTRSGDPGALARQARVVQRWINASQVKREGECIGIGKLCIVGWTDISEEELAGDELGDLSPDDLVPTSAHRRGYDPNQVQVELF
ncbi:unnamed protein product [Closterium sp. Naga37s-1]|nr:unnamed protein product [Closterium sp. Naga37s-1]